jgi:hypothetical protein
VIITTDIHFPFPQSLVYTTYRDKLSELGLALPNISSLEVKSRREEQGQVHCVTNWHGGGRLPGMVRSVLGNTISWTAYNCWQDTDFTLIWRIEPHIFAAAVTCVGQNRFLEIENGTLLQSRGELIIHPHQIKAIPKPLIRPLVAVVTGFLEKAIVLNLMELGDAVCSYLEQTASESQR